MNHAEIVLVAKSVHSGVCWLKSYAENPSDPRDLAITTLALLAAEKAKTSLLVRRFCNHLITTQQLNGSWSDELWDTAWAVDALVTSGMSPSEPEIQAALGFIAATRDETRGAWYEEPFETLLCLDLVIKLDYTPLRDFTPRALDWIASLQRVDGMLIGARYTGMMISVFKLAESKLGISYSREIAAGLQWLRSALETSECWTNAAWSNYYPLRAFLDLEYSLNDPIVAKAVHWFLKSQDSDGKWMQVSKVHDTATAVLSMARLLSAPIIDTSEPRLGILSANRTNGLLFVSLQLPGSGALKHGEKFKVADSVRAELGIQQRQILNLTARMRTPEGRDIARDIRKVEGQPLQEHLLNVGQYAYGHLLPPKIQLLVSECKADHLLLDLDERLIDLPWELAHDGQDFLCLRYAVGRRIIADQDVPNYGPTLNGRREISMLVVSDPTDDLPAARDEGYRIAQLFGRSRQVIVKHATGKSFSKRDFLLSLRNFDLVHYAGHAFYDGDNPDESFLSFGDGYIKAFEIARFTTQRPPALVFLNACWSAEEFRQPELYPAMVRGLGRTFLFSGVAAFIGYIVPVPDDSATKMATMFYDNISLGATIGEALRRARVEMFESEDSMDVTWASAVLYGDPATHIIRVSLQDLTQKD